MDSCPLNELARTLTGRLRTVTSLVKKLVKSGYVETGKAPEDNRVTMAALTEPGARLAATLCRISEKIYELQYQGIPGDEIVVLRSALARMHANFAENGFKDTESMADTVPS